MSLVKDQIDVMRNRGEDVIVANSSLDTRCEAGKVALSDGAKDADKGRIRRSEAFQDETATELQVVGGFEFKRRLESVWEARTEEETACQTRRRRGRHVLKKAR